MGLEDGDPALITMNAIQESFAHFVWNMQSPPPPPGKRMGKGRASRASQRQNQCVIPGPASGRSGRAWPLPLPPRFPLGPLAAAVVKGEQARPKPQKTKKSPSRQKVDRLEAGGNIQRRPSPRGSAKSIGSDPRQPRACFDSATAQLKQAESKVKMRRFAEEQLRAARPALKTAKEEREAASPELKAKLPNPPKRKQGLHCPPRP